VIDTIEIPRGYAGPPFAANGGYVAGMLAGRVGLMSAHVDLKAPVPMDTAVRVVTTDSTATAYAGDVALATASAASLLPLEVPSVDIQSAHNAVRSLDTSAHPFPDCWVCGPNRAAGAGLHLLPGTVRDGVVATPWRPTPWQTDSDGTVPLHVMTAALDCPSAFAVMQPGSAALLASMAFTVDRLPHEGEQLVVVGWQRSIEGRKMRAGTAVTTPTGDVVARASTLWISVDARKIGQLAHLAATLRADTTGKEAA
jgi:hypothetical protein